LPSTSSGITFICGLSQSPSGIGPNTARASSPDLVMTSVLLEAGAQKMAGFHCVTASANDLASSSAGAKSTPRARTCLTADPRGKCDATQPPAPLQVTSA